MIPAVIFLPALCLILLLFVRRGRPGFVVGATAMNFLFCAGLALRVLAGGTVEFSPGEPAAAMGIVFFADGLGILFLVTVAITGMGAVLYAWGYRWRRQENVRVVPPLFWPLWLMLLTGFNGVILSGGLLGIFLFMELVGGAAVGMVAMSGERRKMVVARRYFFIRMPGSAAFFVGVAVLYSGYGSLDLRVLGRMLEPSGMVSLSAALMLTGLLVKASIFPLHFWLPPTHAIALGPASTVLSAIVVKAPFFAALRLWFELYPDIVTVAAAQAIGALGAAGIVWGAVQALRERRLKTIVAYSTVSQMGYLFLLFPLLTGSAAAAWEIAAWTGGAYQAMAHVMAKAALLMGAGVVMYSMGSDRLRDMHGIAGRLPVTTVTIALACVTLIGLPPSGGFIAKWLLLTAALESGQWWWAPVLVLGGLLTAGYAFLMLSYAFQPKGGESTVRRAPAVMEYTALALAVTSIAIGFRVEEPMRLLDGQESPPAAVLIEIETEADR